MIENGLDLMVFSDDLDKRLSADQAVIADGHISRARLELAIARVPGFMPQWSCIGVLPSRTRVPRMGWPLIATLRSHYRPRATGPLRVSSTVIMSPIHPPAEFALIRMLIADGFEAALHDPKILGPTVVEP